MKNTIRNIFHSPKFVIGFIIFFGLLLFTFVYPWVVTADPMEMIGQGNFFKPGTYISVKDTVESKNYTLNIEAIKMPREIPARLPTAARSRTSKGLSPKSTCNANFKNSIKMASPTRLTK